MHGINKKAMNIAKKYMGGNLKAAEFALTNACIAKCSFCDIWKQKPKVFVDTKKAKTAMRRLSELGVTHITLTGGEPLLHPDIIQFVELATRLNIHNAVLNAAPRLLMRNDMIKRLEAAGNDLVSISFDSGDPKTMAESRKIDNIMDEMKRAMEEMKKTNLTTMASVLIWNDNYDKLNKVCVRAKKMGFDLISFNYPTFSNSSVYELGGEGISFPKEHIIQGIESAIKLRRSGRFNVINSAISMENIVSYLKNPASAKYHCFGGTRVLFMDWFFDVYPCMQLASPIGNIFDIKEKDLHLPPCNSCNMSWYRDISVYFHGLRSLPPIFEALTNSGRILKF